LFSSRICPAALLPLPIRPRHHTSRVGSVAVVPDEFVRPRLQVARQIGNALPPLMARAFAMQIGRALGSTVAEMPFPKSSSSEPITVLGKAGVSNLRLAFR
jgi:hypothetical protein